MGFYGSQWAGIGGLWMNPGASQRRRGLKGLKEPVVAGQNRAKIARRAPARPNSKSLHLLASRAPPFRAGCPGPRSEEHTSELQSRPHLVCRLLLEKKKR